MSKKNVVLIAGVHGVSGRAAAEHWASLPGTPVYGLSHRSAPLPAGVEGISLEQEFIIGGYIPGPRGFDALLVGVYEKKELIFVAKVKNGFVPRIRDELFPALKALQITQCPFKNLPEKRASRWGE